MTIKIDKKITGYKVKTEETPAVKTEETKSVISQESMHENIKRADCLSGKTYKIKPSNSDHAVYVTINNITLNPNTEFEEIRPYEIFINSKNIEHYQWVFALTRVISAVFRKGGQVKFLADELKETFDPKGGYFKKNKYIPSLVAEIGYVIEEHLKYIGMIKEEKDYHQQEFLTAKVKELEDKSPDHLKNATICPKCSEKSLVLMDGCQTCVECGYSKCG